MLLRITTSRGHIETGIGHGVVEMVVGGACGRLTGVESQKPSDPAMPGGPWACLNYTPSECPPETLQVIRAQSAFRGLGSFR
jgi:hypothetical protein